MPATRARGIHNDNGNEISAGGMAEPNFHIRTMTRQEVDIAVEWAANEGWNPGLNDSDCYYAADPRGFLLGVLGDEPVATISVVGYGDTFGFLGFYIVKPEYRGRGFGIQIWNAGIKRLEGRAIGLDGVVAQQHNYEKAGFKPAYRNIRYQGKGEGRASDDTGLIDLASLPFETIAAYDRPLFPADRTRFLEAWIAQPDCCALGIVSGGALSGYGVMRRCRSGYKIGPLFADHADLAERLFQAFVGTAEPGAPVFLDVPEVNGLAVELAERHGMHVVFETARMYAGQAPHMLLERQFGVTSFEIG